MAPVFKFADRRQAVMAVALSRGSELRYLGTIYGRVVSWKAMTMKERRSALRKIAARDLDLAWFPDALANQLEQNKRAWHKFLDDVILEAGVVLFTCRKPNG